jgi:hypothetical protein
LITLYPIYFENSHFLTSWTFYQNQTTWHTCRLVWWWYLGATTDTCFRSTHSYVEKHLSLFIIPNYLHSSYSLSLVHTREGFVLGIQLAVTTNDHGYAIWRTRLDCWHYYCPKQVEPLGADVCIKVIIPQKREFESTDHRK